jgi:hypothetical protein
MYEAPPSDFDARAQRWDDAGKVRRAAQVAAAMRRALKLSPSMKALEYGAGTGLLSFALRGAIGSITLADSSAGMRALAAGKIAAANAADLRVIDLDLTRDPLPTERYDLIFSMMTLHHVADVPRLFGAFNVISTPAAGSASRIWTAKTDRSTVRRYRCIAASRAPRCARGCPRRASTTSWSRIAARSSTTDVNTRCSSLLPENPSTARRSPALISGAPTDCGAANRVAAHPGGGHHRAPGGPPSKGSKIQILHRLAQLYSISNR